MNTRHGFRFGVQWASEMSPGNRLTTILLCALALIALALWIVPWNSIFPPAPAAAPAVVAHSVPLPAPSPSPVLTQQVINVSGTRAGAVCVVPTGKVRQPVTLVKVP
jgi:hypothetical protein